MAPSYLTCMGLTSEIGGAGRVVARSSSIATASSVSSCSAMSATSSASTRSPSRQVKCRRMRGQSTVPRITRASANALWAREFVLAARACGKGPWRITFDHILPNILSEVMVMGSLWLATAVRVEASLSFIGLGVNEPLTSLGRLISEGQREFSYPWMLFVPAVTMVITLFSLNFLGDGLRDASDPYNK